ncbi:16392_t:CDS:2, partial [Gigaspora rosea]
EDNGPVQNNRWKKEDPPISRYRGGDPSTSGGGPRTSGNTPKLIVLGEVPAKEKLFVVDITENISTISHLQSAINKEKEPDLDHFASKFRQS